MFSTCPNTNFNFSVTFILLSANAFNLKQSKNLSFGKGLKNLFSKVMSWSQKHIEKKIRNCKKDSNQTHVEFARNKEQLFDRWCCSKKIDQNYDKLRQLMLVEEFKCCIPSDIKSFLDEKQVETLEEAARLADDYYLTHSFFYC